jgi:hypothetical protein
VSKDEENTGQVGGDEPQGDDSRIYVNHCAVSLSLTTADVDFGQASTSDQSVRITSRLRTSPAYFRQIGQIIRAECERYDQDFIVSPNGKDR